MTSPGLASQLTCILGKGDGTREVMHASAYRVKNPRRSCCSLSSSRSVSRSRRANGRRPRVREGHVMKPDVAAEGCGWRRRGEGGWCSGKRNRTQAHSRGGQLAFPATAAPALSDARSRGCSTCSICVGRSARRNTALDGGGSCPAAPWPWCFGRRDLKRFSCLSVNESVTGTSCPSAACARGCYALVLVCKRGSRCATSGEAAACIVCECVDERVEFLS
jgi:hypothetical protein